MGRKMVVAKKVVSGTHGRVGRKRRWSEDMQARFPEGTFERIARVLEPGEDRTDFVRDAVEREISRREGVTGRGASSDGVLDAS